MSHLCRSCIITALALIAVLTLAGGLAHAVPQVLTMTPTSLDQVIQPGSEYSGSFRIINQGDTSYDFHVYATPYSVKGEDYTPDFTVLPTAPNVAAWFKFSTTAVHIKPGQSVTVSYTITVPKNTSPGGFYAAAFAETQLPPKANSVILNERVGEIFYLQAAGPVAKKGKLLTWRSNFFQKPPLTSTLRLRNDGGIHYPATIQVNVRDIFGHTKYSLKTVKEVLPQTIRKVTIPWQRTPAIGLFKVNGTVRFLGQTKPLPTKWVLVMSQAARLYAAILALVIIAVVAGRAAYRRRSAKKVKRL